MDFNKAQRKHALSCENIACLEQPQQNVMRRVRKSCTTDSTRAHSFENQHTYTQEWLMFTRCGHPLARSCTANEMFAAFVTYFK